MRTEDVRLGHITYSNCFPVHARLIDRPQPGDPARVEGIPSELNRLLDRGEIDVAPCSSIEFARHAGLYRVIPELVIGARGPVRSILLIGARHPTELAGGRVAMPTASATSVVLLRILLQLRWGVRPDWFWFDQAVEDPFARGADAALFIGDVALRPELHPGHPVRLDLGAEWNDETGLPFAFAVWQARDLGGGAAREIRRLLVESRDYGLRHRADLAARYAGRFGFEPAMLADYWRGLRFTLDPEMAEGLRTFYRLAAELGEIEAEPELRWTE
jgi:chorismate dehydratase